MEYETEHPLIDEPALWELLTEYDLVTPEEKYEHKQHEEENLLGQVSVGLDEDDSQGLTTIVKHTWQQWDTWRHEADPGSEYLIALRILDLPVEEEKALLVLERVRQAYEARRQQLRWVGEHLYDRFREGTEEGQLLHIEWTNCLKLVHDAFYLITLSIRLHGVVCAQPYVSSDLAVSPYWIMQPDAETEEPAPKELELYKHCLRMTQFYGFRRGMEEAKTQLFEQCYTATGLCTHAWRPVCSTEEFVERACDRESKYHMWELALNHHMKRDMIHKLQQNEEAELVDLVLDRTVTAWAQHLYFAKTDTFVAYEDAEAMAQLGDDVVACQAFLDQELDTDDAESVIAKETEFQKLFTYQGYEGQDLLWAQAFCGRNIHAPDSLDHWEVVMYVIGPAGCGKSTLINTVAKIFPTEQVGVLSSNLEAEFPLQALLNKFMAIGTDLRGKSCLQASHFLCLATNEPIHTTRKFRAAVQESLGLTAIFGGNTIPDDWVDEDNASVRRLMSFAFRRVPAERDRNLEQKIFAQFGTLYRQINCSYLKVLRTMQEQGITNIWKAVPQRFRDAQKIVTYHQNPMELFLDDTSSCVFAPECESSMETFRSVFGDYCRLLGYAPRVSDKRLKNALEDRGCKIVHKAPDPGSFAQREVILGVKVKGETLALGEPPSKKKRRRTNLVPYKESQDLVLQRKRKLERAKRAKTKLKTKTTGLSHPLSHFTAGISHRY